METPIEKIKTMLCLMRLEKAEVLFDEEHRKISLLIDDDLVRSQTPLFLSTFEHVINLILKKENKPTYVVDLNYYRRERERLITELARAAAHKAVVTKNSVELPPMNAYERRLVHLEITTHPELTTESLGLGKERRVIIKRLA